MTDFADARRKMVDGQIRTADVTDQRLIAALLEVPREWVWGLGKGLLGLWKALEATPGIEPGYTVLQTVA